MHPLKGVSIGRQRRASHKKITKPMNKEAMAIVVNQTFEYLRVSHNELKQQVKLPIGENLYEWLSLNGM